MSITVRFTGICTHVTPPGLGKHRVTLVDAHNGAFIQDKKIPPHVAKLTIKPEYITGTRGDLDGLEAEGESVWRLRGVFLELQGTTGEPFHTDEACDIPRLSAPDPEVSVSSEVTLGEQAACYFDFERGLMSSGKTPHRAIMSVIQVEPGPEPALYVRCFWNRKESWIQLAPNAVIDVEHVGTQHGDTDDDFLLHYRVFEAVPTDPFVPHETEKRSMNKNPNDISIGCSNSQYP